MQIFPGDRHQCLKCFSIFVDLVDAGILTKTGPYQSLRNSKLCLKKKQFENGSALDFFHFELYIFFSPYISIYLIFLYYTSNYADSIRYIK